MKEDIAAYLQTDLSFDERARDLVSRMTLEEKISQTVHSAPAIERLGVPAYNWWSEGLHGVARAGVATVFPQAIGLAATMDEELLHTVADVISTEARAKYNEFQRKGDHGIYKGLTLWSPNVNIFRDPRWGRGHETYGEDPYLTSRLGVSFIKGLQGEDPKFLKAAACAKHFAVHSGPESERHSFDAIANKLDMDETYLPAFKACVQEAGVESVMGAYNRVNGEPACGSKTLIQDILRGEWGFDGHFLSDCFAIKDFHENHRITATAPESVALALNNGCDLNCGWMYLNLQIAYNEGLVTEEAIDAAVIRLMKTRLKLGMFAGESENKYENIPYELNDCEEHKKLNLEVSKKTMTLLKNKDGILPLKKEDIKTIAVIGPNADSRDALKGNYFGTASESITVLEGIREYVGDSARVYYAAGSHLYNEKTEHLAQPDDRIAEAVSAAERSDVVVLCLGLDANIEGEQGDASNSDQGGDKITLDLLPTQERLLHAVCETGKPVIVVLLAGSALSVNYANENAAAILMAWYPGSQGGRAIASLLFGEYSPSGRLPVTFYKSVEELPDFRDYSMENRTYRYMKNEPLYPFGFGLSYTTFEYSSVKQESGVASATVKNTGNMESDETAQLYLVAKDPEPGMPLRKLAGVRKVFLKPGEEQEVSFNLPDDADKYTVHIGGGQPA